MTSELLLRLAEAAYHGCDFQRAQACLEEFGATTAPAVVLRIKCLYECELTAAACVVADRHAAALRDDGAFQYYRGVAFFHQGSYAPDGSDDLGKAKEAFDRARELGFPGADLGFGFVAIAEEDCARAIQLLDSVRHLDGELEHVRLRVLAMCDILVGEAERAEQRLRQADAVIARAPSLLLHYWGLLGWAHLERSRGHFEAARMLIETLAAQVPAVRAARLSDNVREELEQLRLRDRGTKLELPQRPQPLPASEMAELGRKRVLNSLFHTLLEVGDVGITKQELVARLWNEAYVPSQHDERLTKSVNRLRQLLAKSDSDSPPLVTQRGTRYVLVSYRSA